MGDKGFLELYNLLDIKLKQIEESNQNYNINNLLIDNDIDLI